MSIRRLARYVIRSRLAKQAIEWHPRNDGGVTMVFSPHYDDETLGAGTAILKLRQIGAPVHIVFMTDGGRSHADAIPASELIELRRNEGLRAAAALGVDDRNVTFLEYPETELAMHREAAVARVAELLLERDCRRVIVPSTFEPDIWSLDHRMTTEIVFAAISRIKRKYEILEYLIWFWYHWPWVPVLGTGDTRQLVRFSLRNAFGLMALRAINVSVSLAELRSQKREALDQHRTQTVRLKADRPWPILADVANGAFLENFFGACDWFRLSERGENADAS